MNWPNLFAARAGQMQASAVRELLKVTAQPDMISFAGGLPGADLFPVEVVREAADAMLRRDGRRALQYGETEGLAELREWLAAQFSPPGIRLSRNHVAIFSGAQQALDLIGRVLLDPGDKVVVENPTYLALLSAWRPLGVQFLPIDVDSAGLRTSQLQNIERAKLVYVIPHYQNPTGATLTLERRRELVRWAQHRQAIVVEDDPYRELGFSGSASPSLFELATAAHGEPDGVVFVGSFSKVLFPGLRIGWVIGPEALIRKLVQAKQAADLHTGGLSQHLAWELIRHGFLEHHLPFLRARYRARCETMLNALDEHFPTKCTWSRPGGGMFVLARLPKGMDAADLLRLSLPERVAFVPGRDFHVNGAGQETLRLNFTASSPEQIQTGIERLGRLLMRVAEKSKVS